ncbi:Hypothetical predicted protein, partial [Mytilus galloprovincialis]
GVLLDVNQTGATYLYHKDKHYDTGFDTGDKSIQCGRHNDVFKLWLMWRSKGDAGFKDQIDLFFTLSKYLVGEIKKRPRFQLVLEELSVAIFKATCRRVAILPTTELALIVTQLFPCTQSNTCLAA